MQIINRRYISNAITLATSTNFWIFTMTSYAAPIACLFLKLSLFLFPIALKKIAFGDENYDNCNNGKCEITTIQFLFMNIIKATTAPYTFFFYHCYLCQIRYRLSLNIYNGEIFKYNNARIVLITIK